MKRHRPEAALNCMYRARFGPLTLRQLSLALPLVCLITTWPLQAAGPAAAAPSAASPGPPPAPASTVLPLPVELQQPAKIRNEWKRRLRNVEPAVNVNQLVAFYNQHNPWILADLDWLCAKHAPELQEQLQLGAEEFFRLESLRGTAPAEYLRMLRLQHLNCHSRHLGYRLYRLHHPQDAPVADLDKQPLLNELQTILAEIFDQEQKNQTVEIIRLEAELRQLRRLLNERQTRKDHILQRRLLELSNFPIGSPAKLQP